MRTLSPTAIVIAVLFVAFASPSADQAPVAGRIPDRPSSDVPAKPSPRLPDGRPDLGNGRGAWNPRVIANLAGKSADPSRSPVDRIIDVPFQPWAQALYEWRLENLQKDDPESKCLPPGLPRMTATPFPFQIFQLTDRVLFVFEGGAHIWRTIFTDGRPHPNDPNPSFLGDSIGHWEGDTLVVDAIGFNEMTWLDQSGHPHTDALHVVERFTRIDEMTLHYVVTIDDPKAYTKPWTTGYKIPWAPGAELYEYICQENNRDLPHMVGK